MSNDLPKIRIFSSETTGSVRAQVWEDRRVVNMTWTYRIVVKVILYSFPDYHVLYRVVKAMHARHMVISWHIVFVANLWYLSLLSVCFIRWYTKLHVWVFKVRWMPVVFVTDVSRQHMATWQYSGVLALLFDWEIKVGNYRVLQRRFDKIVRFSPGLKLFYNFPAKLSITYREMIQWVRLFDLFTWAKIKK